jgi:hypothetical protein
MEVYKMSELIGYFGVDSGQIIIGDPCYLDQFITEELFSADLPQPYPYSYNGACSATCSKKGAGVLANGNAIAVSTGYGDGSYPVYIERDHNGRIIEITISFDGSHETDEDDYETDEDEY